jgi:hypothetical protein
VSAAIGAGGGDLEQHGLDFETKARLQRLGRMIHFITTCSFCLYFRNFEISLACCEPSALSECVGSLEHGCQFVMCDERWYKGVQERLQYQ